MRYVKTFAPLLLILLVGCAQANRYKATFYGTAALTSLKADDDQRVNGLTFSVVDTRDLKVIGHSNIYLPLTNYTAVLADRHGVVMSPQRIPTNQLLEVRGILSNAQAKWKNGGSVIPASSAYSSFNPSIKVVSFQIADLRLDKKQEK